MSSVVVDTVSNWVIFVLKSIIVAWSTEATNDSITGSSTFILEIFDPEILRALELAFTFRVSTSAPPPRILDKASEETVKAFMMVLLSKTTVDKLIELLNNQEKINSETVKVLAKVLFPLPTNDVSVYKYNGSMWHERVYIITFFLDVGKWFVRSIWYNCIVFVILLYTLPVVY